MGGNVWLEKNSGWGVEKLPFALAITVAHFKDPAIIGSAIINCATHGVTIKRCAPAIIKASHDPATPIILCGEAARHIIAVHQHDFKLAATGRALLAGDGWRFDSQDYATSSIHAC
jgi:hypothetical protein